MNPKPSPVQLKLFEENPPEENRRWHCAFRKRRPTKQQIALAHEAFALGAKKASPYVQH